MGLCGLHLATKCSSKPAPILANLHISAPPPLVTIAQVMNMRCRSVRVQVRGSSSSLRLQFVNRPI